MRTLRVALFVALVLAVVLVGWSDAAFAADAEGGARTRLPRSVTEVVRAVTLVIIGLAFGAIVLLVRTILPAIARVTDASINRLTTKRLIFCGLLPLLGAGLLHRGLELLDNKLLLQGYGLVVLLPMALLMMAGLCAALPHLGRSVLRGEREPTPLAAGLAGGLVLGLASISSAWEPLAVLVGLLLASWCLGAGLGTLIGGRNATPTP